MIEDLMTRVFANEWTVVLSCAALLIAMTETGFRFGVRIHAAKDEARKDQVSGIHGAVMGMLALLLGFTFSMALDRYCQRALKTSHLWALQTQPF